MKLKLRILPKKYAICRFGPKSTFPQLPGKTGFFSVTRTDDELSVVTEQAMAAEDTVCSRDWRIIKIEGPLDLTLIGLIAEVSAIFRDACIPIFTLSTYETDYILVKESDLGQGARALEENGHEVIGLLF